MPASVSLLLIKLGLSSNGATCPLKMNQGLGKEACLETERQEENKIKCNFSFLSVKEALKILKENCHATAPAKGSIKSFKVNNCLSLTSPHSFEIKWPHFFSIFRFVFGHVADSLHHLSTRNFCFAPPSPPNFAGTHRQTRHLGYVSTSPSLVINRSF